MTAATKKSLCILFLFLSIYLNIHQVILQFNSRQFDGNQFIYYYPFSQGVLQVKSMKCCGQYLLCKTKVSSFITTFLPTAITQPFFSMGLQNFYRHSLIPPSHPPFHRKFGTARLACLFLNLESSNFFHFIIMLTVTVQGSIFFQIV